MVVLVSMTQHVSTRLPIIASSISHPVTLWRHCLPPVTWSMTSRWMRHATCMSMVELNGHLQASTRRQAPLNPTGTIHLPSTASSLLVGNDVTSRHVICNNVVLYHSDVFRFCLWLQTLKQPLTLTLDRYRFNFDTVIVQWPNVYNRFEFVLQKNAY